MPPSLYTQLPTTTSPLTIRLIRLQPSDIPSAPISCKLVVYTLTPDQPVSIPYSTLQPHQIPSTNPPKHIYECLSYVWGSTDNPKTIQIHASEGTFNFEATQNLHAALVQLRDPVFERFLWTDAICIDQGNNDEKAVQVAAMARIYGMASRVVAWLGGEEERGALALRVLGRMAHERRSINESSSEVLDGKQGSDDVSRTSGEYDRDDTEAVHALLNRNYFRRMWVRRIFIYRLLWVADNIYRYYKRSLPLVVW